MKVTLFRDGVVEHAHVGACRFEAVETMFDFYSVEGICLCCVGKDSGDVRAKVRECGLPLVELDHATPLPIEVEYDRATLGVDRVAAAAGVAGEGVASLVVDAGTAVTLDVIGGMRYLGGNISPGLKLRFRSLNEFTSRLPLVSPAGDLPLFGHDTDTAIRSGVVRGLIAEISDAWSMAVAEAGNAYDNVNLILTGGDAPLLAPLLRRSGLNPVCDPEAVGRGLVRIFNHNIEL